MWNMQAIDESAFTRQVRHVPLALPLVLLEPTLDANAKENKANGMVCCWLMCFCFFLLQIYTINTGNFRQCSECDKESSGSEVERVDTSAPRKLRHCKEDGSQAVTPTPPEAPIPSTPNTPATSKNIVSSSAASTLTSELPSTPKVITPESCTIIFTKNFL